MICAARPPAGDRALPAADHPFAAAGEARRGVKSEPRARPLPPDTIILETLVELYFFWILLFCRWAGGLTRWV
jgi:hypothetical protein